MLIQAALFILILAGIALCIFLIIYLNRVTKSVQNIGDELEQIANRIDPILESFQKISDSIVSVSSLLNDQIEKSKFIIDEIKTRIEALINLEKKIKENVDTPIENLQNNLTAVKKGISAFFKYYKKKNNNF